MISRAPDSARAGQGSRFHLGCARLLEASLRDQERRLGNLQLAAAQIRIPLEVFDARRALVQRGLFRSLRAAFFSSPSLGPSLGGALALLGLRAQRGYRIDLLLACIDNVGCCEQIVLGVEQRQLPLQRQLSDRLGRDPDRQARRAGTDQGDPEPTVRACPPTSPLRRAIDLVHAPAVQSRHLFLCATLALCGCLGGPEDLFTQGRAADACRATVPVCSTTAGCVLDAMNYTSGSFAQGGTRRLIVRTTSAATIEVDVFFATEGTPGTDTEIGWYEVGCSGRVSADSGGTDVFAEAGPDRVWKRSQKVNTAGDHLVEVFSDAQADYLLRVVVTPVQ